MSSNIQKVFTYFIILFSVCLFESGSKQFLMLLLVDISSILGFIVLLKNIYMSNYTFPFLYGWQHTVSFFFFFLFKKTCYRLLTAIQEGILLPFMAAQCSIVWMGHGLLNYSPPDGHMGCFQSFDVTNGAAMSKLSLFIFFF